MPEDRAMEYLDLQDAAADWQPVTAGDELPVTFREWNDQRTAAGLPWKPIYIYLSLAPWLLSEWTGAVCPLCGAPLKECENAVFCPVCECSWAGLDAVEATRAAMHVLTDEEVKS